MLIVRPWQGPDSISNWMAAAGMQGRWVWQVKDCIDRAFVNRFGADLDFASMERHALPARAPHPSLSTNELRLHAAAKGRCGGCGSKVGGPSLRRVLQQLSNSANVQHGVLVGLIQADDAAVLELPPLGHVAVQSVDFFRASGFVTDPYLLGQIAANHAVSDVHAMGACRLTLIYAPLLNHSPSMPFCHCHPSFLPTTLTQPHSPAHTIASPQSTHTYMCCRCNPSICTCSGSCAICCTWNDGRRVAPHDGGGTEHSVTF
jgi:hypothetical protein